jgi:glutaredoxin 3
MAKIELFTQPNCQHCNAAKAMLKAKDFAYVERDVALPEHLREFASRLPRMRSLPQVFVNGEHIGNDQDLQIWANDGRLAAALKD